jgi:hypothetical protein
VQCRYVSVAWPLHFIVPGRLFAWRPEMWRAGRSADYVASVIQAWSIGGMTLVGRNLKYL